MKTRERQADHEGESPESVRKFLNVRADLDQAFPKVTSREGRRKSRLIWAAILGVPCEEFSKIKNYSFFATMLRRSPKKAKNVLLKKVQKHEFQLAFLTVRNLRI